jgi:hypothetical protein
MLQYFRKYLTNFNAILIVLLVNLFSFIKYIFDMKKAVLSLALLIFAASPSFAQSKKAPATKAVESVTPAGQSAAVAAQNPDAIKFESEVHDFGTVPEGPAAEYEFKFTNTGKEPIVIQRAQPSCGCTTPSWSKDPVLPGKTGAIKASYGTQGRPNSFNKTITVFTNVGTKVLTIKGNVEKAPESSVPENTSMIKTR